ncbi:MAG TPA: hypothetical protein VNT42_08220 [Sphingomonas sp.]|nr:hypothetical protein [Sphingomonas sp.]
MIPLILIAAEIATSKPKLGPIEKERKIVVDAVRGCPEGGEGEIVVCSKDRGVAEGYRLPRLDPRFDVRLRRNGRGGIDRSLGASGVGSCSATGAGGSTGCSVHDYDAWGRWKREQKKEAHAYEDPN